MQYVKDKIMGIPGALLLVPMAITAVLNTYASVLDVGNPTSAVFSSAGTMTIIGIMLVVTGIQMNLVLFMKAMKRGGILVLIRMMINVIASILFIKLSNGNLFGISVLTFVVAITSYNPGVYMAIIEDHGDEIDKANFALLSLVVLPIVPAMIISFDSGGIDYKMVVATLIPLVVGIVIGKIFPESKEASKTLNKLMLPFLGACLGSAINLELLFDSWLSGFILFIVYMLINFIPLYFIDTKLLKQSGIASIAICCVGGISLTAPLLISSMNPEYLEYVDQTIAQVSIGIVLSAIIVPLITKRIVKKKAKI